MAEEHDSKQELTVVDTQAAIVRARGQLAEVRRALAAATGGASPRSILAELAQELAADLAGYFDELPMHQFSGATDRESGFLRHFLPRMVPHRVVMGRYHTATVPRKADAGWTRHYARIFILGLGADGILRRGRWNGFVQLPEGTKVTIEPVLWDNSLIRRVPTAVLVMRRWTGGPDPTEVAAPGQVLDVLTGMANKLATESQRDLALLQRFL
jgi:hypothetical protein